MMVKDMVQKYQDDIKLHGEVGDILIAPEMGLYNELRYKYYQIALKVKESYIQTWNGYDNYGSMVKQMDDDFESCMEYAYEEIGNDLISMGIYDMDKKAIVDYASEFGIFNNYLDIKDEFLQTLGAIQQELNNKVAV